MPTEAVENYLKAVLRLSEESPVREATVSGIATIVGVTPGTATSMVRTLSKAGLARYRRYGGVQLTPKGKRAALDVLRRHRVIEAFLVLVVGMDWADVHEEAERLEHAVSPKLLDRLDEMLGRPACDPHGDPIPDAKGALRAGDGAALSTIEPRTRVRVRRILDQKVEFLTFLAGSGLRPGVGLRVVSVSRGADSITVQATGGDRVTLSLAAAAKVLVEPVRAKGR